MGTGSGSFFFLGGAPDVPPAPVPELYGVFRRSARPSDLYAQRLARRDQCGVREEHEEPATPAKIRSALTEQIGTPLYDQTRLLAGTTERGVYAVPTTAQAICLGFFPDGGGSCGRPGRYGVRVAFNESEDGSLRLYGIVGDEVARVEVAFGNRTQEVELSENGYWLELVGKRHELQALILHLHGGVTHVLPLKSHSFG